MMPAAKPPATREQALAALIWQLSMGADAALDETPSALASASPVLPGPQPSPAQIDRTLAPPHSAVPKISATATAQPLPPVAATLPAMTTAELAKLETLDALREAMAQIDGLSIRQTAMNMVFGEGPRHAPLMLIGEAPGEEEDRTGHPFIGRAGQLLDKMISILGFTRDQVYITNVLPWRPPGNRTPKVEEVATCLPYLMRHIELVKPQHLLLLGGPSAKALLGKEESVTRLRGLWWTYHSPGLAESIPTLVTYHPAYLLRTPSQKRESWRDLRLLKKKIDLRQ
jgi:uracil-DNA glycosylase family 4